jgi:hypothetical protein
MEAWRGTSVIEPNWSSDATSIRLSRAQIRAELRQFSRVQRMERSLPVCTENFVQVDDVMELPKLAG